MLGKVPNLVLRHWTNIKGPKIPDIVCLLRVQMNIVVSAADRIYAMTFQQLGDPRSHIKVFTANRLDKPPVLHDRYP